MLSDAEKVERLFANLRATGFRAKMEAYQRFVVKWNEEYRGELQEGVRVETEFTGLYHQDGSDEAYLSNLVAAANAYKAFREDSLIHYKEFLLAMLQAKAEAVVAVSAAERIMAELSRLGRTIPPADWR